MLFAASSAAADVIRPPGAGAPGGGDNVGVNGAAATDPDFRSDGDNSFVRCTAAGVPDASCVEAEDVISRVQANSVALGTDTTGSYALGDAEGGAATTGDSATAFFAAGTIEDARIDGSAEADEVNPTLGTQTQGNYALGDSEGGAATTGDSATAFFAAGTIEDARIDGSAESDEVTGLTDAQVSDTLTASTSTLAAANDNDTSIATTSFVQQEIDDGDFLTDNCTLENDSTPIPDSCVGNGTDDTSAGGGIVTVEDIDSNPTYTSLTKLSFNQADGFVITNPVSTEAQIDQSGFESFNVEGFTGCGNTTDYMGLGSNTANCNATEGNVDVTHVGPTMTVGNLKCFQATDTTCTTVFTIMKNGGASAASAATCTNVASCAASTTTDTIASGDTWSIRVVDNLSTCTSGIPVSCQFTGTW